MSTRRSRSRSRRFTAPAQPVDTVADERRLDLLGRCEECGALALADPRQHDDVGQPVLRVLHQPGCSVAEQQFNHQGRGRGMTTPAVPTRDRLVGDAVDQGNTSTVDATGRRHLVAAAIREQLRGQIPGEYTAIAADVLAPLLVSSHAFCRLGMQHCPTGGVA